MACSQRSFLATMTLAVAAACTTAWDTAYALSTNAYNACLSAYHWVIERVFAAVPKAIAQPMLVPRVSLALVQARAFVLRLAKRETPRLTPGWRMCPST